jgi:hypothetical protein
LCGGEKNAGANPRSTLFRYIHCLPLAQLI